MVLKYFCILKRPNSNTMFKFYSPMWISYDWGLWKKCSVFAEFWKKKLPENSLFFNDDPSIFFHTTYSLNQFSRLVHLTHCTLLF
jgi:hypothetical protein